MDRDRDRGAQLIIELIPRLVGWLASDLRRVEPNLSPGHFYVLLILARGGCSLTDLASGLEVSLPTMSNTISTLDERGWVSRQRAPGDRRRLSIELTPEGWSVLERMSVEARRKTLELLEPVSDDEYGQIVAGLETLGRALKFDGPICGRASSLAPVPAEEPLDDSTRLN